MCLTFPELAVILGVSETCIWGWETGRSLPLISVYPAIISFLGYVPFPTENLSFGKKLLLARQISGKTRRDLARIFKIGAQTIDDIENQNTIPKLKVYNILQSFIDSQLN